MFEEITINELAYLFTEPAFQQISVYSIGEEKYIYEGTIEETPAEIGEMEILSLDTLFSPDVCLTINVE